MSLRSGTCKQNWAWLDGSAPGSTGGPRGKHVGLLLFEAALQRSPKMLAAGVAPTGRGWHYLLGSAQLARGKVTE